MQPQIDWLRLIEDGPAELLAATVASHFDLPPVDPRQVDQFHELCRREAFGPARVNDPLGRCRYQPWSDSSWWSWFKNRLDLGAQAVRRDDDDTYDVHLSVTLHVGFIGVAETDVQLARLRGDRTVIAHDAFARSKLVDSMLARLCPIDRVAARVAPQHAR